MQASPRCSRPRPTSPSSQPRRTAKRRCSRAQEHRPDVVLMDIRMPVLDGIAATRRICAAATDSAPRVLVLTTFDLDEYVYDALQAGASGFLLKDVPPETLFEAVRVVAAGDALLAPAVTRRLIAEFARLRPPQRTRPEDARRTHPPRARDPRAWSQPGSRTKRSPTGSCSATRPSRPTSATSCASSACETAHKPSSPHTSPASSSQAPDPPMTAKDGRRPKKGRTARRGSGRGGAVLSTAGDILRAAPS